MNKKESPVHRCLLALKLITEAGATNAFPWVGRGEQKKSDRSATSAIRNIFPQLPVVASVFSCEGEKDQSFYLSTGERVGSQNDPVEYDLVVDPVECTTNLSLGLRDTMSAAAMAPKGHFLDVSSTYYMDKFVSKTLVNEGFSPEMSTYQRLQHLSNSLDKPLSDLTIFVLNKPRHRLLIHEIYAAGARVYQPDSGDIVGAILAATPGTFIDALMGIGGSPEGLMAAVAIKTLGGIFWGRMIQRKTSKTSPVYQTEVNEKMWHDSEKILAGEEAYLSLSLITDGNLGKGIRSHEQDITVTTCLYGCFKGAKTYQNITTSHRQNL